VVVPCDNEVSKYIVLYSFLKL